MDMKHLDPRVRITIYFAVLLGGGALVTWGITTQEFVDALLPVVAGLLSVGGGATALRNITPEARDEPLDGGDWAEIARDGIPTILVEVSRLRGEIENLRALSPGGSAGSELVDYVPERAPWLDDDQGGQHRLDT